MPVCYAPIARRAVRAGRSGSGDPRPITNPASHLCPQVPNIEFLTGFNYYPAAHLFIGTQFTPEETAYGPAGVYFTTSPDFVHWSKPALAMTMNQMLRREPNGNWTYAYARSEVDGFEFHDRYGYSVSLLRAERCAMQTTALPTRVVSTKDQAELVN